MADYPQPTFYEPMPMLWRQSMQESSWMERSFARSFADSGFVEEAGPSTPPNHGQQIGAGPVIAEQPFAAVARISDETKRINAFPKLTGNEGLGAVCNFLNHFNSSVAHLDGKQRLRELLQIVEGDADLALRYAIKQEFEDASAQSRPREYGTILRKMVDVLRDFELEDADTIAAESPKSHAQKGKAEAQDRLASIPVDQPNAVPMHQENEKRNEGDPCWHPKNEDVPPIIGKMHDLGLYIQNQKVSAVLDMFSPVSLISARRLFELFGDGDLDPRAVKFVQGGPKVIEFNGKNVESFGVAVVPIHRKDSPSVRVSFIITTAPFGHDLLIGSNAFESLGLRIFDTTEQKFVEYGGSERVVDPVRVGSVTFAVPSDKLYNLSSSGTTNARRVGTELDFAMERKRKKRQRKQTRKHGSSDLSYQEVPKSHPILCQHSEHSATEHGWPQSSRTGGCKQRVLADGLCQNVSADSCWTSSSRSPSRRPGQQSFGGSENGQFGREFGQEQFSMSWRRRFWIPSWKKGTAQHRPPTHGLSENSRMTRDPPCSTRANDFRRRDVAFQRVGMWDIRNYDSN